MKTYSKFHLKVCGLTQAENISMVSSLDVSFMGFIFYEKSKRFVGSHFKMPTFSNSNSKKVGVFVNETEDKIIEIIDRHKLDLVQLHGDETPEDCKSLSKKGILVMKAFGIDHQFNFEHLSHYAPHCTYFLFDTKSIHYGGTGVRFDWDLLNQYKGETPFLLSGGLNPGSLESLTGYSHPNWVGVDFNSGFESEVGIKNFDLLKSFIGRLSKKKSLLLN